jgi:hypothetical protein
MHAAVADDSNGGEVVTERPGSHGKNGKLKIAN